MATFTVDKMDVCLMSRLVAIAVITSWVHWGEDENGNKRPLEHRVTAAGKIHPDKDDLPDRDDCLWPPGLNGEPPDPWRDTRYLYLVNPRTGGDSLSLPTPSAAAVASAISSRRSSICAWRIPAQCRWSNASACR